MEKGRNDNTIDKMAVEEVNKLLLLPTLLPFQLYGLGCGIFPFPNHWITICMIEGWCYIVIILYNNRGDEHKGIQWR